MKWFFAAVCGGLVLALAVSFPNAQDTAIEKAPAKEGTGADKANPTTLKEAAPDAPAVEPRPGDETNAVRDPQTKLPAAGRSGTKRADLAKDAPKTESSEDKLKIFRLQRANAKSAYDVIDNLYYTEVHRGDRGLTVDARTNSLVLRGPRDFLSLIEALLIQLDDAATVTRDNAPNPDAGEKPEVPSGRAPPREDYGQAYRQHEDQAARLAAGYRNQLAATPADRQKLERLKAELQGEVSAAFEARQGLQRSDMDRLRGRLAQIERQIESRQQRAQEIISNRIEELLHPEQQWEAGDDSTDSAADTQQSDRGQPPRRVGGTRLVPEKPRDVNSAAATAGAALAAADKDLALAREKADFTSRLEKKGYSNEAAREAAAADLAAKEIRREQAVVDLEQAERQAEVLRDEQPRGLISPVSRPDRAGLPLFRETAANPRKALLDAESAIATARSTAAQAEKALTHARELANRISELSRNGAVSMKEVYTANAVVAEQDARRERALIDLDQAERQAALAREDLAAQIDLLKINLDEARLQLENASQDEQRAKNLFEHKAMSKEEYVAKALAERQAELQVERATRLLDLYRKALPGGGSAGDKRTTDEKSATKRGDPIGTGQKE